MEYSEFSAILADWCESRPLATLDCWIDDANARLAVSGDGIRLSLDVLDPYEGGDPQRLTSVLVHGGAGVACACGSGLAIDPDTRCVVLVSWIPNPVNSKQLLEFLERLANQRAAMLRLMQASIRSAPASPSRSTLSTWRPGV
jgi:hypothetical protein